MSKLAGKKALVTGGSRGIGAAIAQRLAEDGADVVITYVSNPAAAATVTAAIQVLGRKAHAIQADAADPDRLEAAVNEAACILGGLDILVNNAGIYHTKPLDEFSTAEFDHSVAINIRAAFVATRTAVAHMKSGGRVISIGSGLADRIPFPGNAVYAMTKAAIATLMQGLARELGPSGITLNTVHPGSIDTDMNPADGAYANMQRAVSAVGHYGKASDIAAAVAYLASPEAGFVTGTRLTVDGGFTV